jgi:hypothetical protein
MVCKAFRHRLEDQESGFQSVSLVIGRELGCAPGPGNVCHFHPSLLLDHLHSKISSWIKLARCGCLCVFITAILVEMYAPLHPSRAPALNGRFLLEPPGNTEEAQLAKLGDGWHFVFESAANGSERALTEP